MKLELNKLSCNPDLQVREQVFDFSVVSDYAEAMTAGETFPPITVFYDGNIYWLADGFHRYAAANQAKLETIEADVRPGSKRDAILYAVGANADNGLRRTNQDKRNAVMKLLNDKEWAKWGDREIARMCKVDHKTVSALRPAHLGNSPDRTVARNGATYTMDTSKIGHREPLRVARVGNLDVLYRVSPPTSDAAMFPDPTPAKVIIEPMPEEVIGSEIACENCQYYNKGYRGDELFFCGALFEIYSTSDEMPCEGNGFVLKQLGHCTCCGQPWPEDN